MQRASMTRPARAPEGQRNVARGGAQRNPWFGVRTDSPAPEGRRNNHNGMLMLRGNAT